MALKKEIITEKRYSFELGGIKLTTRAVTNDSLIDVSLYKENGGTQLHFTKQDIKNLSTLFNELVSELEKEEIENDKINPPTPYVEKESKSKFSADNLNLITSAEVGTTCAKCIHDIPNSRYCDTCFNGNGFTSKPKEEVQEEKERGG